MNDRPRPSQIETGFLRFSGADFRLLIPAAATWVLAWLAVGTPSGDPMSWVIPVAVFSVGGLTATAVVVFAVSSGRNVAGLNWNKSIVSASSHNGLWLKLIRIRKNKVLMFVAPVVVLSSATAGLASVNALENLRARADSPLVKFAQSFKPVALEIIVTSAPQIVKGLTYGSAADVQRLQVDGTATAIDGASISGTPVRVSFDKPAHMHEVTFGSLLSVRGRVIQQGSDDRTAFRVTASEVLGVERAPPWFAWAGDLRSEFRAAAAGLAGEGGELVPGLAIGDTMAVSPELDEAMKASSLSHLTAVSGANCVVVTAAAFWLLALCRARRMIRIAGALLALLAFVVLVTPEASVVRAAVMACVVLIALARGRFGGGVPALGVAVIVLLIVNPWYARDYGFALSVSATLGLLLLTRPIARVLERLMPAPVAMLVAVPLAAQLACQPVLILLSPQVALYGVWVNLLAAPAATLATALGLIGCLLLPILPGVGFAFLQIAWVPATWITHLARVGGTLPFATLPWIPDFPGALLLLACTSVSLWLALGSSGQSRGLKFFVAGVLALLLAVPVGAKVAGPALLRATRPLDWLIAMCDIGQGDAVFVRSNGAVALIDAGPDLSRMEQCRASLGIEHIDLLILTHWDTDHVAGASVLAGRVDTVLHGPLDGERSAKVIDPLDRAGADTVQVVAGDHGELGELRWRVLWPTRSEPTLGNDASVVIEVEAPSGFRAVFLGDLGEESQRSLFSTGVARAVDVVKVAHHGSADQYDALYEKLHAKIGLIGVGVDNSYGHPTQRLLSILGSIGTETFRTDIGGQVIVSLNDSGGGSTAQVWVERGALLRAN